MNVPDELMALLRATFLEEARELLVELEASLLVLEAHPGDADAVNRAFRAAHTVKGSAASVGEDRLSRFTHRMEDLLSGVRRGALDLTSERGALLLRSLDALAALLDASSVGAEPPDTTALEADLAAACRLEGETPEGGAPARAGTVAPPPAGMALDRAGPGARAEVEARRSAGGEVVEVRFVLPEDAFFRGLDPLAVFASLSREGTVLFARPLWTQDVDWDRLDPERCVLGFELLLAGEAGLPTVVGEVLEWLPEESEVRCAPVEEGGDGASSTEPSPHDPPPPSQAAASAGRSAGPPSPGDAAVRRTIRVDEARVDALVDLVGEAVTARNALNHAVGGLTGPDGSVGAARRVKEVCDAVGRIVNRLQADVLSLRMVPLGTAFQRLPRVVRDVARDRGREVRLVLEGEDTEVDRSVAESLVDPLLHLLRNAVDHGVEPAEERIRKGKASQATIRVSARRDGGGVAIVVADDGKGIDTARLREKAAAEGLLTREEARALDEAQALQLVFRAGLSTAGAVTDISGRGVGMDAVRVALSGLGGSVRVESEEGAGTAVHLSVPLNVSLVPAILVRVGTTHHALALDQVRETLAVPSAWRRSIRGLPVMAHRGRTLPLQPLAALLGDGSVHEAEGEWEVVVVEAGGQALGLVVDDVAPPRDIMIKSVPDYVAAAGLVSGATILGDGTLATVLDAGALVEAGRRSGERVA